MPQTSLNLLSRYHDLNILYVEDNKMVREDTQELLHMFFTNVDIAQNGLEGFERFQAFYEKQHRYYDIVLTDINMPKMNGIEMIKHIRKVNERQDIIVISAHNEVNYLLQLIDLEVTHFILKPIDLDRFKKVFSRVIEIIEQKKQFKVLYDELERSKQLAESATKHKSRFLAKISHEIRTPLNAITGFIKLLKEDETDPTKIKYMNIIKNSSDSLLQIINDILDISKIESGKLKTESCNFNPYESLIPIAELFQANAAEKNIDFKIKYNNNMPKILFGDILRIKQIFANLLSNAVKFTPEGSIVKSVIWYKDGYLNIVVKDYGIGISEEKQKSIFKPFIQADDSTARNYGGTGLGLTISLEFSRLLNGQLTFKSEEGSGSIFRLSLPIPIGEEEQKEEQKGQQEEMILHGHILIVEDYEANRMFLGIILDNAGLTYEMAEDGLEAVEKFKTGKYDLILMDENMPNMCGMDANKEILQIEKEKNIIHTPVISLTANALQGDKERFLASGFDDHLSKPIDPETLLLILSHFLNKKKNNG